MERLLEKNEGIQDIVKKINDQVDRNFDMLSKTDDDIIKWTTLPELMLLDTDKINRLIAFVKYLDTTRLPMKEKSLIIISLSGLIKYFNLDVIKYDDGNLYLISNHYQNTTIEAMKNTISIINNNSLLLAVRNKTLDLNDRKVILKNVEYDAYSSGVDASDSNQLNQFINFEIEKIRNTDFYS